MDFLAALFSSAGDDQSRSNTAIFFLDVANQLNRGIVGAFNDKSDFVVGVILLHEGGQVLTQLMLHAFAWNNNIGASVCMSKRRGFLLVYFPEAVVLYEQREKGN